MIKCKTEAQKNKKCQAQQTFQLFAVVANTPVRRYQAYFSILVAHFVSFFSPLSLTSCCVLPPVRPINVA
jgi:hypothetical protein